MREDGRITGELVARPVLAKIESGDGFKTVAGIDLKTIALDGRVYSLNALPTPKAEWERVAVAGKGVFRDASADAAIREAFFAQHASIWQLVVPGLGTLEGPFLVAALEYAGEHDGEATFAISLASAGPVRDLSTATTPGKPSSASEGVE